MLVARMTAMDPGQRSQTLSATCRIVPLALSARNGVLGLWGQCIALEDKKRTLSACEERPLNVGQAIVVLLGRL